jgi:integrase
MIGTISIRTVEALAPGQTLWDAALSGFGCRRQISAAVYIVKYRTGGAQRFLTIGKHGPWTPDKARKEARRLLGEVAAGSDPASQKAEEKRQLADTLAAVAEAYLAVASRRLRPKSLAVTQRYLRIAWAPLHGVSVFSLSRREIASRLRELTSESGPDAALGARRALSAMFTWAIGEGYELPANPVAGTNRPEIGASRDRVLTPDELRSIWHACGDDNYGRIVRLLMLTAQRRSEIGSLRWSELAGDCILLPASRTKNHSSHSLPLTPAALSLLPPRRGSYVFGLRGGFSEWSIAKARLDEHIAEMEGKAIADWRLHDLRRTAATMMADRLGILPHIIETILNHTGGHKSGEAGVYNRARYTPEVREALTRWADHIERIAARPLSLTLERVEG